MQPPTPEADVFLVSDHGFGPSRESFFLNTWLAEQGYLEWAAATPSAEDGGADLSMEAIRNHANLLDWDRTRAYVFTPSSNGIRINLAREGVPGPVKPEEYEGLLSELRNKLLSIRRPQGTASRLSARSGRVTRLLAVRNWRQT